MARSGWRQKVRYWDGPAVLPTRQRAKLAYGDKDREHAMSSKHGNAAASVVGIDIGKNSFHVVGQDDSGAVVLRQKWSRGQVEARLGNLPPCLIGMEACVGAHHRSRKLRMLGHDARLMPDANEQRSGLYIMVLTPRGLREDETRWRIGLPGACEPW